LATLGTHDLAAIKPPFSYEATPPEKIQFVPLKQEQSVNGLDLEKMFTEANDASMIKYLGLIRKEPAWPVLYDSTHEVLSVPPVVNSKYSQISLKTTDILVECTSATSQEICTDALNELLDRFSKLLQETSPDSVLMVEQIKINSENGHTRLRYPMESDIADICEEDEE